MINEINLAQNAQHAQYTILLYFFPRQYKKIRIGTLLIFSLARLLLQGVASFYKFEQTRQGFFLNQTLCNTCNYSLDGGRLV